MLWLYLFRCLCFGGSGFTLHSLVPKATDIPYSKKQKAQHDGRVKVKTWGQSLQNKTKGHGNHSPHRGLASKSAVSPSSLPEIICGVLDC